MNIVHVLAKKITAAHAALPSPFLVAICGWADTGKSTLAGNLCKVLETSGLSADCISTDAFMKERSVRNALGISGYNPLSVDEVALSAAVKRFVDRQDFTYHPYDNRTGSRSPQAKTMGPRSVIVVEGIHAFHPAISNAFHQRVFIDADEGTMREMRVRANIHKRGMAAAEAALRVDQELDDFGKFIVPRSKQADVLVTVSRDFEYLLS